ncbi:MAG: DUF5652 family protein [Candidatus Pacearchaeota archaeon]
MGGEVILSPALTLLILVVVIWDAVWKIIGSWRAGRNNQPVWFVFILILNTIGILPIIYLTWFQKNKNPKTLQKKISKKK